MAAGVHDIALEGGVTFAMRVTCGSLGAYVDGVATIGTPRDFTGATGRMQIKDKTGVVLVTLTTDVDDGLTFGGVLGTIDVLITDERTRAAAELAAKGKYDILCFMADGSVYRPIKGAATLDLAVTELA